MLHLSKEKVKQSFFIDSKNKSFQFLSLSVSVSVSPHTLSSKFNKNILHKKYLFLNNQIFFLIMNLMNITHIY